MARFKTINVETGEATVSAGQGVTTVVLESDFLNTPNIYVSPGTIVPNETDPGTATHASWNANVYVSDISNSGGAWTFNINTEENIGGVEGSTCTAIHVIYRAIGSVSGV